MAGESFDLTIDADILNLNSPLHSVGGPYNIVYKNITERWAVVALDWDGEPRLGIRWFWGSTGTPNARGYATWFVIPPTLVNSILDGLPLHFQFRKKIEKFLNGELSGSML